MQHSHVIKSCEMLSLSRFKETEYSFNISKMNRFVRIENMVLDDRLSANSLLLLWCLCYWMITNNKETKILKKQHRHAYFTHTAPPTLFTRIHLFTCLIGLWCKTKSPKWPPYALNNTRYNFSWSELYYHSALFGALETPAKQSKAKQNKTKQSIARQSKANQIKAKQSKNTAKQSKSTQIKSKQSKAKQGKAKQSKAKQSKAK